MLQALFASYKSKDPHTKVGCVFVDKRNHQVTMGYNGMIAGIDESRVPWARDPSLPIEEQKYGYVMHAEANAISHSQRDLEGCRAYVTLFPCNECAKLIASRRVAEIIFLSDRYHDTPACRMSRKIFDLSGISYRQMRLDRGLVERMNDYLLSAVEASQS
jgi:dCMP deaminase